MEVLSPGKKHTQALEMVSEEEEEVEAVESEHEEGEICTEEEEEEEEEDRRANKKFPPSAAVASEVIYDDNGRTEIFTTHEKKRLSSYPRRSDGSRQHGREGPRRKDKVERGRRHHSSSAAVPEKWPKVTRRTDSKSSAVSEDSHLHKGKEVRGSQKVRRNRQSSPESSSGSSSSSSCSCSSSSSSSISYSLSEEESDVASVSPCKGRGKENRRCGPSSKGHDRSPPPAREYGCDRPPSKVGSKAAGHRTKHSSSQHRPSSPHPREPRRRPSYHHNIRRSPKARAAGKASHHRTHQKPAKPKPSERKEKEAAKTEKPAKEGESVGGTTKGQNWLPRGSLGEMLLSRPKVTTHPTPTTTTSSPPVSVEALRAPAKAKQNKVGEMVDTKPALAPPTPAPTPTPAPAVAAVEAARELPTLDQEDDEELQLRYIAIQSSLRLLTDMQKEGQQQETASEGALGLAPTDKAGPDVDVSQEEVERVPLVEKATTHLESYTPPLGAKQEVAEMERTLGEVLTVQSTDDIISISSSSSSEICLENLATNKSYLLAAVGKEQEGSEEVGEARGTDEARRKARERPDVDQDPVDMEICDSSGEEEGGVGTVEVVRDSPLSPEVGQDAGQGVVDPPAKGEGAAQASENVGSGNFQIPVEWAYMVPPPPPPDQPANDLQNISSWCYDQNMYLQSMQAAPTEEHHHHHQLHQQQHQHHNQQHQQHQHQQQHQQQQHNQPDTGGGEWVPPQPLSAPWPPPFMDSYDSGHPSSMADNTDGAGGMGVHPHHHNYAAPDVVPAQEAGGEQSKDLRDTPAEHYQAFMSVVLQQQSPKPKSSATFTECPQRNLIMVPLSGTHHSKATPAASRKAKVQKQRAKKRRLKKQRAQENLQQVTTSAAQAAAAAAGEEEEEEEDEDLLRAQLLIDMSRKKEQRINESQGPPPTTTTATTAALPLSLPTPASRVAAAAAGREGYEGRASPQVSLPSSESLSPVPRSLRMVKSFATRPRSGENSPTHSFRGDLRPGLSDIGGWGLDPKGSKFNYHSMQHDFPHSSGSSDAPKVKFPPIKPIIISLRSDSEDSEEEDQSSQGTSSQDSSRKEAEAECLAGEPMSQSIDILLKSMRNANPAAKDHDTPANPKPGPSTAASTPTPAPAPTASKRHREVADNTPQAVRHLSRHQQEEYRWLKEQLRKKEMLQRKKMQQRPPRTKPSKPLLPTSHSLSSDSTKGSASPSASPSFGNDRACSVSPAKEVPGEAGSEGMPSSARAVTWKNMGLLQIQVSNEGALDTSTESEDSCRGQQAQQSQAVEGYSSLDASATEDEDEETLRRMALLTQKKKMESSAVEGQRRRVVIEEKKAEESGSTVQSEVKEAEDVPADALEEQPEDGLKGEWMVLDEVREEELCIRSELSENEMDDCGEGDDTSDARESISRSPERPASQSVEARQDTPKEEQQTLSKNTESKIGKGEASTNDTTTDPHQAPPLDPEGGSSNSSSSVAWEETREHLAVKTDTKQTAEASCDGEKIEEVIRRIESKSRVVREKAGSEGPSVEPKKSSVSTQGSGKVNSTSPALLQERKVVEVPGKEVSRVKANEGDMKQTGTSHPVTEGTTSQLVKPSTATTSTTSPSVDTHKAAAKTTERREGKAVPQRIVVMPDASALAKRKVKVVRAAVADTQVEAVKETSSAGTSVTALANGTVVAPQEADKLKRVEKEYREKKSVMNKLKMQLADLLKEVNEEQRQREELKKSVGELKAKLKDMEMQLESKSSGMQSKIEVIRQLQKKKDKDQQTLTLLEHQGERIGKRVYGNGYTFPKVIPSSPNSKTKDAHITKSLASSIAALHQQVRNLTKRKNNLASGVTKGGETRVVRVLTLEPKKESATGNDKPEKALLQVSPGKAPPDPAGKPQGKVATTVKRKLVSSGVVGSAKVAKVEVPMESSAIQEKRVTGVPSVPTKAKEKIVEEKLDEMKALCPHDLLGRCNDSACQYQHLPSARPSLPPATTRESMPGTDPAAACIVKRASGGKTGAGVKVVPARGSDGKGAAGRTVGVTKATKMVTEAVVCESSVPQVTGASVAGPDQTGKVPVTETHSTHQQINTHTLTATDPLTPTTHHTDTLTNTATNTLATDYTITQTPTTHQETKTHTTTETHTPQETEETHTMTHSHQLTEAQDSRELVTAENDTATPTAMEEETESQTEAHSETKDSEGLTEQQDESETQTETPSTAPQGSEMQETHAEEIGKDTALQNEAAIKETLPNLETQNMTCLEIEIDKPGQTDAPAGEGTETQGLVDTARGEVATDDELSSTTLTAVEVETEKPVQTDTETQGALDTAEGELKPLEEDGLSTSTAVEDKSSGTAQGAPKKPLKKTRSRVTRSRAVTKSNAEDTVPSDSLDTSLEEQAVENVEEASADNQDTRVTRKSLRVKAKTSPKCRVSLDTTRASPRNNKKRKSNNIESPVRNTKRRTSTRL